MSRVPFDTTRLDEECERIAASLSMPEYDFGPVSPEDVLYIIFDVSRQNRALAACVFAACQRPKVVPA